MRKLLIALVLLCPVLAGATSGDLYLGKYLGPDQSASEPDNTSGADWVVGVELEEQLDWFRPFVDVRTIIDKSFEHNYVFHPGSVEYGVGFRADSDPFTLEFAHRCWHHIDKDGRNQSYNLLTLHYKMFR